MPLSSTTPIYPIILAAGASVRLAPHIKQLCRLKSSGLTLVEHCVEQTLKCSRLERPVTIVLGANHEKILKASHFPRETTEWIFNPEHAKGLGNSIAFGAQHIHQRRILDETADYSILLLLADQFEISDRFLERLLDHHIKTDAGGSITATSYGDNPKGFGPPVVFSSKYHPELMKLQGDSGAKLILKQNAENLQFFQDDAFKGSDLDTPENCCDADIELNS